MANASASRAGAGRTAPSPRALAARPVMLMVSACLATAHASRATQATSAPSERAPRAAADGVRATRRRVHARVPRAGRAPIAVSACVTAAAARTATALRAHVSATTASSASDVRKSCVRTPARATGSASQVSASVRMDGTAPTAPHRRAPTTALATACARMGHAPAKMDGRLPCARSPHAPPTAAARTTVPACAACASAGLAGQDMTARHTIAHRHATATACARKARVTALPALVAPRVPRLTQCTLLLSGRGSQASPRPTRRVSLPGRARARRVARAWCHAATFLSLLTEMKPSPSRRLLDLSPRIAPSGVRRGASRPRARTVAHARAATRHASLSACPSVLRRPSYEEGFAEARLREAGVVTRRGGVRDGVHFAGIR